MHNFVKPEPQRARPEPQAKVADSLQALLERQSPRPRSAELASMFSQSGIDTSEHYQEPVAKQRPTNMFAREEAAQARPQTQADSLGFDNLDRDFDELDTTTLRKHTRTKNTESEAMSTMREEMNAIRQLL